MGVKNPYEGADWITSMKPLNIDYDEYRRQHETSFRGSRHTIDPVAYEVMKQMEQISVRMDYMIKRMDQANDHLKDLTNVLCDDAVMRERSPFLKDAWEKYQTAKKLSK